MEWAGYPGRRGGAGPRITGGKIRGSGVFSAGRAAARGGGPPHAEIPGYYFGVTVIVPSTQVMVPPVKSLCLPPGMSFSSLTG